MPNKHEIVADDIMPMAAYAKVRRDERRKLVELKRQRRIEIGPFVTFYFECYETMWHQVHEMVYIEKGGAEQVPGELAAYNPLVPKCDELVATVMIEIDDPDRRQRTLAALGGIERTAFLSFAGETIAGEAEEDAERSTPEGKASSVQFIHFRFRPEQIAKFRRAGTEVTLGLRHASYRHMTILPETVRATLAQDFD
jgi:hypothetical protein